MSGQDDRIYTDIEFQTYPEENRFSEDNPMPPEEAVFPESSVFDEPAEDEDAGGGLRRASSAERPAEKDPKEPMRGRGRSRRGIIRGVMGSAMRAGAALACIAVIAAAAAEKFPSDAFKRFLEPAVSGQAGISASKLAMVWNGDPEGPHDYDIDHPVVLSAADCENDGVVRFVCLECGAVRTEVTEKTGHRPLPPVMENEIPAACTADGSVQEAIYCEVCGKELSRTDKVIKAPGHTAAAPVMENVSEAACTEAGSYDQVVYCSVCGEELSREKIVHEALGHSEGPEVRENEVPSTCTEEGSYQLAVYCERCGSELSRKTVSLPLAEHVHAEPVRENVTPAGCVDDGSYEDAVYCRDCGTELSRTAGTLPALGHEEGEARRENVRQPSCTEDGSYEIAVYCSRCKTELSREGYALVATGHDYEETVVPPGCTEKGFTRHVCSRCGDSFETDETEALGHDFDLRSVSGQPLRCSRCGAYAMSLSYSDGDQEPVFTAVLNSGLLSAMRGAGMNGVLHVESDSGAWISEDVPVSGTGCALPAYVYGFTESEIRCRLVLECYDTSAEYLLYSPYISIKVTMGPIR